MKTNKELEKLAVSQQVAEALEDILSIVDSHSSKGPVCTCDVVKPGYTCPYCRARFSLADLALAEVHP